MELLISYINHSLCLSLAVNQCGALEITAVPAPTDVIANLFVYTSESLLYRLCYSIVTCSTLIIYSLLYCRHLPVMDLSDPGASKLSRQQPRGDIFKYSIDEEFPFRSNLVGKERGLSCEFTASSDVGGGEISLRRA
jgi:hypothetical protein